MWLTAMLAQTMESGFLFIPAQYIRVEKLTSPLLNRLVKTYQDTYQTPQRIKIFITVCKNPYFGAIFMAINVIIAQMAYIIQD